MQTERDHAGRSKLGKPLREVIAKPAHDDDRLVGKAANVLDQRGRDVGRHRRQPRSRAGWRGRVA